MPEGLSTIQQLLWTMAQAQIAAHARMLELAETSPVHIAKAYEMLMEQYKARATTTSRPLCTPPLASAADKSSQSHRLVR